MEEHFAVSPRLTAKKAAEPRRLQCHDAYRVESGLVRLATWGTSALSKRRRSSALLSVRRWTLGFGFWTLRVLSFAPQTILAAARFRAHRGVARLQRAKVRF